MKYVRRILIVLLLCVFLFSGWKVVTLSREYLKSGESYSELEQYVSMQTVPAVTEVPEVPDGTEGTEEATAASGETEPTGELVLRPMVDFEALSEINPDIVGWIYLPDSKINYPIVQRDNEYYLKHLFTGEYNSGGCIFLDERNGADFSDEHSILYGHHMKDGSMFAGITAFQDQAYYDAHPTALLITPEKTYKIQLFSCYVADTKASAWDLSFGGDGYGEWLDEITRKSYFRSNVQPTSEDRVLTLSTCTYDFENARFVLHGVITEG